MADSFDAYYKWLGIAPKEQPPNHYRLLAINLFESDPDVIEAAADRQMTHLRSYQTGPHSAQSQKLLNQCAAARVTLLNPQKKEEYDRQLRETLGQTAPQASTVGGESMPVRVVPRAKALPATDPGPVIDVGTASPAARSTLHRQDKKPAWLAPAIGAGGAVALALLAWVVLRPSASPVANGRPQKSIVANGPKTAVALSETKQPSNTPEKLATAPTTVAPSAAPVSSDAAPAAAAPMVAMNRWREFDLGGNVVVDDFVRITQGRLSTRASYDSPIEVSVVARTNKNNIRMRAFREAGVIWNWEINPSELRVGRPDQKIAAASVEALATDTWYRLKWRIRADETEVYVDDKLIFHGSDGPYIGETSPVWVETNDSSVVDVKSFEVRPLASGALPPSIVNTIGMKLQLVAAGEFEMGLTDEQAKRLAALTKSTEVGDPDAIARSLPRHHVKLTRPFYMGIHEVTLGQFRRFVEATGYETTAEATSEGAYGRDASGKVEQKPEYGWRHHGFGEGDDYPVVNVSSNDAESFCRWLSDTEKTEYRLPTEAEWEYACRAGSGALWSFGDELAELANYAWFADNRAGDLHSVGQKHPNAFGLFDMYGNAWERCQDGFAHDYYGRSPASDPPGELNSEWTVKRGGAYPDRVLYVNSAVRSGAQTRTERDVVTGFRIVRVADGTAPPPISAPARVAEAPPANGRKPVPDEKAVDNMQRELQRRLKTQWPGGKDADSKLRAADSLLKAAAEPGAGAVEQYVLLLQARDLCAAAGDFDRAADICEQIAKHFDISRLRLRSAALSVVNHAAKRNEQRQVVIDRALELIIEAIDQNEYDVANDLIKLTVAAARTAGDRPRSDALKQTAKDVANVAREFQQVKIALERLQKNPGDAEAHSQVGKFDGEVKYDWLRGLPHLAKGADADLAALATQDLTRPADATQRQDLAAAWLKSAARAASKARAAYQERAIYWLEAARPACAEAAREALDKQIAEIEASSSYRGRAFRWRDQLALGVEYHGEIDCRTAARQFDLAPTFDIAKSWTLDFEFNAPALTASGLIFFIGDDRGGRDPLFAGLPGNRNVLVNVANAETNESHGLASPFTKDNVDKWKHVRVSYGAVDRAVVVELDGKRVGDAILAFSPKIDVPMPVWIGGANANDQRFLGKVRRIRLRNLLVGHGS